jgi:[ribosomal protein S18]-alanine N-acetyltransferase
MIELDLGDAKDVPEIISVMEASFDPKYGEAWTAGQCVSALALPGARLAIARSAGQACGFAIWRSVLDESELMLIATDPTLRNRGIASDLLKMILSNLKANGIKTLHVEVRSDNPALEFYGKHDFEQVGKRSNYYRRLDEGTADAITLRLQLE